MSHPSRRMVVAAGLSLPLMGFGQMPLDVRKFGARADGKALDHIAINKAIAAASKDGGGTVYLPAGTYLCFSIRLMSNVALVIGPGATIVAADPKLHGGSYDMPEVNEHDFFQDFGHSHWQNSLIWGDGIQNVSITGPGRIDGTALTKGGPGPKWSDESGRPVSMRGMPSANIAQLETGAARMRGLGNKAIALKNCRGVTLRDFSVLKGGHFALLATGVDGLTIDGLKIDTNRDGFDIDVCRNVHIANCSVNSPNDDAIVLKSSLALGIARPTENVTITNCIVSGFDVGTMLDGTYGKTQLLAPDRDGVTGRIKFGTESNGGFRNIAISNCVFDRCRGLALESVDGGVMEDVTVSNLTMRDVTTAPLFIRTGDRRRAPAGVGVAVSRRITISNVTAYNIDHRYAASIVGLPDSPVEDVMLSDIRLVYGGGGTAADAAREIPEERKAYPDPSMFGVLPAYGLYVRHAKGVTIDGLEVSTMTPDARPPLVFDDAKDVRVTRLKAKGAPVLKASEVDLRR